MLIIIDAYNILKQVNKNSFISENQRKEFINILNKYANITKNNIVLVFDGGYDYPTKTQKDKVTVIYSGRKNNADYYIKNYIIDIKNITNSLIVSSDRKVCQNALSNNISVMDSLDFYKLVLDKLDTNKLKVIKTEKPIKKLDNNYTDTENSNLEELYSESKVILYKKEDNQNLQKDTYKNKISKQERKLVKILKKL